MRKRETARENDHSSIKTREEQPSTKRESETALLQLLVVLLLPMKERSGRERGWPHLKRWRGVCTGVRKV